MKYIEEVKNKGQLPHCSFPGGYPIYYIDSDGEMLCDKCASKQPENIIEHDIHWEGPNYICNECYEKIESAYGNPEEEE